MPLTYTKTRRNQKSAQRKKLTAVQRWKPKINKAMRYADMAYKGYRTALYLKNLLNVEQKFLYATYAPTLSRAGVLQDLNVVPTGTTDQTRVGDSILNRNLIIQGHLFSNSVDSTVRIMIIKDKQDTMTAATLLRSNNTAYAPFGTFEKDYRLNYTVLYDKTFVIDSGTPRQVFSTKIALDFHTRFNNATNTINTNSLRSFIICSITTTPPSCEYTSTLQYIDN